jgi:hypothetical protein
MANPKVDYIVRDAGADLSDLLAIHQSVFTHNQLSIWETDKKVIVKVSNRGEATGKSLDECKTEIGYAAFIDEKVKKHG